MKLTSHQVHVLENLNRVLPSPSRAAMQRFELDGRDCTAQIRGLVVHKLVVRYADGRLKRWDRRKAEEPKKEPKAPSMSAIDVMRAALSRPGSVHKDPRSASARAFYKIAP